MGFKTNDQIEEHYHNLYLQSLQFIPVTLLINRVKTSWPIEIRRGCWSTPLCSTSRGRRR